MLRHSIAKAVATTATTTAPKSSVSVSKVQASMAASAVVQAPVTFENDFWKMCAVPQVGDYPLDHPERVKFHENLGTIRPELAQVLALYRYSAIPFELLPNIPGLLTATTHNDFYKFTMAPVIDFSEKKVGKTVMPTFGIDIRNKELAKQLLNNTKGSADDVVRAMHQLSTRFFEPAIIKASTAGKPVSDFWNDTNIERICGSSENPRTLISATRPDGANPADYYGETLVLNRQARPDDVPTDGVVMAVYVGTTSKGAIGGSADGSAEPTHKLYVEATGPWGRVSFLETAMMQAVYQIALQHELANRGESYGQWLYEALFRCHLSMTHAATKCPKMAGALFSGRRTGHHVFTIAQVLYLSRFYPKCIGTSSVDAWFVLTNVLKFKGIVPPVGTHAHELSMVLMAIMPQFDQNEDKLALTQVIGHWLYYRLVHKGFGAPMPMLPDTLGTFAFLKVASSVIVYRMVDGVERNDLPPVPFSTLFTTARQDSGKLLDFANTIKRYKEAGFLDPKLTSMASEVEGCCDLDEAQALDFSVFGTGGFMGDSEKVWKVKPPPAFSASMAVKAVRVFVEGKLTEQFPIKLGDASDTAKVSGDTTLPDEDFAKLVHNAVAVKNAAIAAPFPRPETTLFLSMDSEEDAKFSFRPIQ